MRIIGLSCDHVRGLKETLSVSAVSMGRVARLGAGYGLMGPCGAHGEKAKNSGQGRGTDPPWVEKDRFPFRPAQRKIGVLPKDSTYMILLGIVLIGINHTDDYNPIGL